MKVRKKRLPFYDRFWAKIDDSAGPDGCWLWTGALDRDGYGQIQHRVNGRFRCPLVHRVAYEMQGEQIPEGDTLDHLCRVRNCVNPAHLEPVTQVENVRRGEAGKYNRVKTHCKHGHEFNDVNTLIRGGKSPGDRHCRVCSRERYAHRTKGLAA